MTPPDFRSKVRRWLDAGLSAVDPEKLMAEIHFDTDGEPVTIIAIGKAAAGMCRGAEQALGPIYGVCVTDTPAPLPPGVELIIGDHPIPGPASFEAGRRVLGFAQSAPGRCIALISGGGSALCEQPLPGIEPSYMQKVNTALLDCGASIEDTNLVRGHLSAIKCGGIARAATGVTETYILSDVAGAAPAVVASGPTIPMPHAPDAARAAMERFGIAVPNGVWDVMRRPFGEGEHSGPVTVLADGHTAAGAIVEKAHDGGVDASLWEPWLGGELVGCLEEFLRAAGSGVTVAAGEANLRVTRHGVGGRNTHAALLAAQHLAGTDSVFAAFATDGIDGRSDAAGAIVDGSTVARGGDPQEALMSFDSASYLDGTADLVKTGPTGTNVADIWLLWRP